MSTESESFDLSSLTLKAAEHHDCDYVTAISDLEGDHDINHTPTSFLSLPREIRDMIYELVAISCEASKPPNLVASRMPGYEELIVADGRWRKGYWQTCRNTGLPRNHSYNSLILANRQINAEIAVAARVYLPFSICIGTRSAEMALSACHELDDTTVLRLDTAKSVVLSFARTERRERHRTERSAHTLGLFFAWYKQRIQAGMEPRLVIVVEGFFTASCAIYEDYFNRDTPIEQLISHLDIHILNPDSPIRSSMMEIGYILSECKLQWVHGHLKDPEQTGWYHQDSMSALMSLIPWAHLITDTRRVQYSPSADFTRIAQ